MAKIEIYTTPVCPYCHRAKGLLIDECGMKEGDAFSFIQRTAMSERTKMRDVAERILDGTLRP